MTVKQNQPQHRRLNELFEQYAQQDYQVKGAPQADQQATALHGRTEQRFCYAIGVPPADKVFLWRFAAIDRPAQSTQQRPATSAVRNKRKIERSAAKDNATPGAKATGQALANCGLGRREPASCDRMLK
ncbi:MAG: hypothetical protein R3B91_06440 [Planctomycetaceae bacterium]